MTIRPLPLRLVAAVALALAVAALATDLVSTQGRRSGRRSEMLNGREVAAGEVLIRLRNPERAAQIQSFIEQDIDADEVETVGRRGLRRMKSRRMNTQALIQMLQQNPEVELVEPNYVIRLEATPNDPSFNNLWGLLNFGQSINGSFGVAGADVSAADAWEITRGSRGSVVGVIDTGIDYNHPDLAANMWTAPSAFSVTIGGLTINCAAGTRGFNAINNTCNPMDDHYHGTHVAGTIGAVGNNGVGVAGVNWVASMMGLKFLSSSGSGWTSDAIKAIEFAVQAKMVFGAAANVRVLNNSWGGGGYSQALKDEIDRAAANDMLFVAAAGNNAANIDVSPQYPASYPSTNMVAVASTTNREQLSSFSNYGAATVHLGAPGSAVLSTMPGNTYSYLNGTSMATPHVAGAAALVLAQCPAMTTAELKTALLTTVDMVAALAGRTTTGGRLNAHAALGACRPKVTSVTIAPDVASPRGQGTTITWTATASGGVTPYSYKWLVFDGVSWTFATGWVSSNTFAWTPVSVGNYRVGVWVRSDGNSADVAERAASEAYQVVASTTVTSVSLTADRAAPQAVGTMINWTAVPAGGLMPQEFKWWVSTDGVAWTPATGWTTANTFLWTPSAVSANHRVRVWAKSGGNPADAAEASATSPAFAIAASTRVTSVALTPSAPSPQGVNTAITWTATPAGGVAPHQYKWLVHNGTAWQFVTGWTASNTFAWTPTAMGNYLIGVWVKSAGNLDDTSEAARSVSFTVVARTLVSAVSISADKASPQVAGTTIRFTATSTGGVAPVQYQFVSFPSGRDWNTSNTWDFTPNSAGTYTVNVFARGNGGSASEAAASITFTITGVPMASIALSANRVAPQPAGTPITWTAMPSGGTAPNEYKWFEFDGTNWVVRQNWGGFQLLTLTPSAANPNYAVRVWGRSGGSTTDAPQASATVNFAITAPVPISAATITTDKASPQPSGSAIAMTANVTGGTAPFTYRWDVYNGATLVRDYGWTTTNLLTWASETPGNNWVIRVRIRNATNITETPDAIATIPYVTTSSRVTAVTLTPDRASPQAPGTTITWTAAPTGGISPHQYKFWVFNGVSWAIGQDWSAANTFAWIPPANGTYYIGVWVKSAGNPADAAEVPLSVTYLVSGVAPPRVGQVTLMANRVAPQLPGTTVTWTAGAVGGTAPYQFKWALYDGSTWTDLTGWTAQNTYAWTPGVANPNYIVRVWARSAGNGADAPEGAMQVGFAIGAPSPVVTAVTLGSNYPSPQAPGLTITFTAGATGGTAPYQYKFWLFDGVSWRMVRDWSASNQMNWQPLAPGTYAIGVWVKSAGNPNDAAEKPHSVAFVIQ